jgi:hypothetical protein
MGTGEIFEIIGTNPDTRKDILEVLQALPCEVLSVRNRKDRYLIRLRKPGSGAAQIRGEKQDSRPFQAFAPF